MTYDTFLALIEPELPPPGEVVIADIYVTKTTLPVGQTTVIAGNTLTYRVTAGNLGPDDATGVAIQDTLPVNTQLISTAPSAGGTCTYNATTRLVDCRWPADLPVGATVFVDITVRVCPDNQCDTILDNRASAFMLGGGVIPGGVIYGQDFASNLGDFTLNNELPGRHLGGLGVQQHLHAVGDEPGPGPHAAGRHAVGDTDQLLELWFGGVVHGRR